MIDVEPARSGHPVLLKDGRYLGSSVDPGREAERWAVSAQETLAGVTTAVVLGLGCGYHVRELLTAQPRLKVIVVESDAEVVREALRLVPSISKDIIILESDWSRLLEHPRVLALTHEPFRVLKYGPSCQSDELFFRRAEALILARDRTGFFLQLRDRPALLRSIHKENLDAIGPGPISIKTVLSVLRPDAPEEKEALLWKMLGELVK